MNPLNKLRTAIGMVALGVAVLGINAFFPLPATVLTIGSIGLAVGGIMMLIGKNRI